MQNVLLPAILFCPSIEAVVHYNCSRTECRCRCGPSKVFGSMQMQMYACLWVSVCVGRGRRRRRITRVREYTKTSFLWCLRLCCCCWRRSNGKKRGRERQGEADRRLANVILLLDIFSFFSSVLFVSFSMFLLTKSAVHWSSFHSLFRLKHFPIFNDKMAIAAAAAEKWIRECQRAERLEGDG